MKLVSDWRHVWKYYSTQALIGIAALPVIWMELPSDLKAMIPTDWHGWIVSSIAVAGAASRVIKQRDAESD